MKRLILLLALLHSHIVIAPFAPDPSNFDTYGLKFAANDVLFVQALNQESTYTIQFAPYDNATASLRCSLDYKDETHYVYSLGVGSKQSLYIKPLFYVSGEIVPQFSTGNEAESHNGTFIGIVIYSDVSNALTNLTSAQSLSCGNLQTTSIEYVSVYGHQEHFVIAVEPYGQYAIVLATEFVFRYQPFSTNPMLNRTSNTVWPQNVTFQPCAADATTAFTIVAGFVKSSGQLTVRATPTVYLISNVNLSVIASWSYRAVNNTWQARLTYIGVDSWSKKLTMSVKINSDDPTRVLVGMPFLNTVFLFQVSKNETNLTMVSSQSNGMLVGFGRGVTWLSSTQAAILYSAYSPDYSTFYGSKVYVYTGLNDSNLPSSPTAVFPNAQQPLPSTVNAKFIRMISTPGTLGILDEAGGSMLIISASPGRYASTDITQSSAGAAMPVVSHPNSCIAGTYKAETGIHPCILCPAGSRNPGLALAAACINCSTNAFCPLGAIYDVDNTSIMSVTQAVAYPRPPEATVYEDILLNNMVTLGSTAHCLRVSPLFWSLVLLLIIVIMLLGMASLNLCVKEPKRTKWRTMVKNVFLRTDLVVSNSLFTRILMECPLRYPRAKENCGWVVSRLWRWC